MKRRQFLQNSSMALGGSAASMVLGNCASTAQRQNKSNIEFSKRPNIILIMGDDMGYSDIGCYGSEIRTPNLDKLGYGGLRFTQFYNTARCCPTRASLLTGLYQHQAGIGHMVNDRHLPGYRGDLNRNSVTIAEVLKTAGYSTYMSGKWHVTPQKAMDSSKHNWPRQRGFDRFFGTIHGAGSFYDPNTLTLDNSFITPWEDFYYTDAISDYACNFVNHHRTDDPFFMYVSYTAAHWPMHAREKDIEKYKGRYDEGWDTLRKERHARMKKMGLVDPNWDISPRDQAVPAWEDEDLKDWQRRRMEVYAAMVEVMDEGIGRIIETLKAKGLYENTLIFFVQDNGGCAEEYGSRGNEKPDPANPIEFNPMALDEFQFDMQPKVTRDGRPVRTGEGVMPGPDDTYIAYGKGWANASNTPFRMYKHWVHEGGISTPLIMHWAGEFAGYSELCHQPGHLIDIMATCVDVSGANYPEVFHQGNQIHPMEGKSLLPAVNHETIKRDALYWEHEGNRAVRVGDWKLVSKSNRNMRVPKDEMNNWELYDMLKDRTEMHDLINDKPELANALKQKWYAWAERCNVLPWPWSEDA